MGNTIPGGNVKKYMQCQTAKINSKSVWVNS